MTRIRHSADADLDSICSVHEKAFGAKEGSEIVELVRELFVDETARPVLSLVAEADEQVVGHVLFTRVLIEPSPIEVRAQILAPLAVILAPLAVLPDAQNAGVGGDLIRQGLEQLASSGVGLVFVLGYPAYYTRFGFEPATRLGLLAPHPIPAEYPDAWMVQALQPGLLDQVQGTIQCARALNNPKHW